MVAEGLLQLQIREKKQNTAIYKEDSTIQIR